MGGTSWRTPRIHPKGREKSEPGSEVLNFATIPLHQPCIQHLRHADLIPNSPCLAPQSQQQSYPKLDRHLGVCGGAGWSQDKSVCPQNMCGLLKRKKKELPLLEVCVEDPVGESLAADADPFQDTVTPQLVQHQEGIHGSCGGGQTQS